MRKPTSEEIADLFDTNPEFFAAVLGRETVISGDYAVIVPSSGEMEKAASKGKV